MFTAVIHSPATAELTESFDAVLQMCLLFRAGELSVIEYGTNEVLAVCRTEHMSPFLLSVAAVEPRGTAAAAKRVAYLVDLQTIRVLDLLSGASTLATVSHDCRIDWLVRGRLANGFKDVQ